MSGLGGKVSAATGVVVAAAFLHAADPHLALASATRTPHAAKVAIAYAREQIGRPYLWGGTGPDAFDCSGLVYEAYRERIPRTSELQWVGLPHVSSPKRGYLVFFAGSDGTASAPGHVGLVLGPHRMEEAYAAGYPIRIVSFGLPSSPPGDQNPVGFADPTGG